MTTTITPKKILVVASLGYSLVNFRLELLKRMAANGHQVLAIAPEMDTKTKETLEHYGIETSSFPMSRAGLNPFRDFQTILALRRIIRKYKPDHVMPYAGKPIIYASLAGRLENVPHRFGLFTGLGFAFLDENPTGKKWLIRQISIFLHRFSTKGMEGAFTYNPKETEDLRNFKLVPSTTPVLEVPGSGVDMDLYQNSVPDVKPIRFLMVSRLLKSKGAHIFVAAAQQLKDKGYDFDAQILGPMDANPDAISQEQLDQWVEDKTVSYLGETSNVRPFLKQCSVMVLPSMYREGIPRSILEAMSSGRAVITSDMPGCAHSITDKEDGFIVKTGDISALANAMEKFILEPELAIEMGRSGHAHASAVFDVHKVNKILLTEMGLE
jgi:glycosyltransferase involved in cell wall biosynthesis